MHAFDILGDPVRRRILELLADAELTAGEIVDAIGEEFAISQPAVSQHLRVLREAGFTARRAEGTRRLYSLEAAPLRSVDEWLTPFRRFWAPRLDALSTEIARGKRQRRIAEDHRTTDTDTTDADSDTDTAQPPTSPDTTQEKP
ncbi:ArsR/SmtB family transcription factor [Brevibacterium spongiae]|uniref:Metalloregulator ArsR/SmtB family transcription factor n=1 Tax=Brevibacterium spongiae TaxID=2909672 RepID=A0ABY5SP13_9MICO|nr:metalloregulator ArsR/SmtB family transcription factor [Brevibacterium spongiae]UVI36317.1 metalloregulator ArsR/SmtB family transcription factor [Brevibacterium spongiae]